MNILPKKKWHVRTKENMARVRRDEAKAAADQMGIDDRVKLADHEDRVRRLKMRGATNYGPALYEPKASTSSEARAEDDFQLTGSTQHVNLFAELEEQERKNLGQGNKDYAAEKKKERDEYESKMGIMKHFAEDTKEFSKEKYWWESIPLVRETVAVKNEKAPPEKKVTAVLPRIKDEPEKSRKRHGKRDKSSKRSKHRRRRSRSASSKSSPSDSETKVKVSESDRNRQKLQKLRAERVERERIEKERAMDLLRPKKEVAPVIMERRKEDELKTERSRKYNSQFNPDFVRK